MSIAERDAARLDADCVPAYTLDSATVTLARGSGMRIALHVVAPETDAAAARLLLRELSTGSS